MFLTMRSTPFEIIDPTWSAQSTGYRVANRTQPNLAAPVVLAVVGSAAAGVAAAGLGGLGGGLPLAAGGGVLAADDAGVASACRSAGSSPSSSTIIPTSWLIGMPDVPSGTSTCSTTTALVRLHAYLVKYDCISINFERLLGVIHMAHALVFSSQRETWFI